MHTARQTNAYANNAVNSCYIINQSCNIILIQMKSARKVQVIVSQFRHKTSSNDFTNRESTFIICCELRCENTLCPIYNHELNAMHRHCNASTVSSVRRLIMPSQIMWKLIESQWCSDRSCGLVVSSIFTDAKLRNNFGQVVHTYVPLSPISITWYRSKDGVLLRLGS